MKKQKLNKSLSIIVLLFLWPICLASAVGPSPAGGGWLEVSKPGGYAFIEDHNDFDVSLADEFTFDMWIYLKRPPEFRESWVLLHKEECYLLTLSGHHLGPDGIGPLAKHQICNISYYYSRPGGGGGSSRSYIQDVIPLNRWHHLTLVFGNNGYLLYINGKAYSGPHRSHRPLNNSNFPLYIGGTGISPFQFRDIKWVPFTGGFIDEVRVSNIARHLVREFGKIDIPQSRFKPDENTMALWHFGGSGTGWLKDASGNGHTLTAFGVTYHHSIDISGKLPSLWGRIKKE